MALHWSHHPSGKRHYYPLYDPRTDSWPPLFNSRYAAFLDAPGNTHDNVPMLLSWEWDRSTIRQLAQNDCTLIINFKSISQHSPQERLLDLAKQVMAALWGNVLTAAWADTRLFLTFSGKWFRDEAFKRLCHPYVRSKIPWAFLNVHMLRPATTLEDLDRFQTDTMTQPTNYSWPVATTSWPSSAPRNSLFPGSHLLVAPRDNRGAHVWWSILIRQPHNTIHVYEAILRYYHGRSCPQFIVTQFGMPDGITLVHFESEPTVSTRFLTLENPTLVTDFRVLQDLDVVKCRLQLDEGKSGHKHSGHQCAIQNLDNPRQEVCSNVMKTKVLEQAYILDRGREISGTGSTHCDENRTGATPTSMSSTINGRVNQRTLCVKDSKSEAHKLAADRTPTSANSNLQNVSTLTNSGNKKRLSNEEKISYPHPAIAMTCPLIESTSYAESDCWSQSIGIKESEQQASRKVAKAEEHLKGKEAKSAKTACDASPDLIQEPESLANGRGGGPHNKDQQLLTFTDIEAQEPLETITFHNFRTQVEKTQAWKKVLLSKVGRPGEFAQAVEFYSCFLAHYYSNGHWDEKIRAFRRGLVTHEDPRVSRSIEYFMDWLQQQRSAAAYKRLSFPYYGIESKTALMHEMKANPARRPYGSRHQVSIRLSYLNMR